MYCQVQEGLQVSTVCDRVEYIQNSWLCPRQWRRNLQCPQDRPGVKMTFIKHRHSPQVRWVVVYPPTYPMVQSAGMILCKWSWLTIMTNILLTKHTTSMRFNKDDSAGPSTNSTLSSTPAWAQNFLKSHIFFSPAENATWQLKHTSCFFPKHKPSHVLPPPKLRQERMLQWKRRCRELFEHRKPSMESSLSHMFWIWCLNEQGV